VNQKQRKFKLKLWRCRLCLCRKEVISDEKLI